MPVEQLRQNPMMAHLLDAMENGDDIGHYGRLTFVMVAQYFLSDDEMIELLTKDQDCDEEKARMLINQVKAHGYNPPKPDRILEWMQQQDFDICDASEGKQSCNVYKNLKFPPEVYQKIASYYKDSANS